MRNKAKDLDWTILFSQGHLWSQKEDLCFVIIIHNVKNNEFIFWSPSHQHNAHTVPTTLTESLGFGTEPGLPKERWSYCHKGNDDAAALTPLGGQVWIDSSFQFPHVKIQCLYSFKTSRGLEGKLQERFETIHNEPWSVILEWCIKNKKCFTDIDLILLSAKRFRKLRFMTQSASIGNSWNAAELPAGKNYMQTLLWCSGSVIVSFKLHSTHKQDASLRNVWEFGNTDLNS